jgi:hypothetical protein
MTTSNDVLIAANALTEGLQLVLRDGRFADFIHLSGIALQLFTVRQHFERNYRDNRTGQGFDAIVDALATATAMVPGLDPVEAEVDAFSRRAVEAIRLLEVAAKIQPVQPRVGSC